MTYARLASGIYVPMGRVDMPPAAKANVTELPRWVPTSESEIDNWAAEHAEAWARPKVQAAIRDTRGRIIQGLGQGDPTYRAPTGRTLDGDQIAAWAMADIADNGFPTDPDAAAAMTMRLLDAQGESMGFHPGFVGEGVELVLQGWPEDADAAEAWGVYLGNSLAQQYGVSIPNDFSARGLVSAAASGACLQAGVPYVGVVSTSIDSLWDGRLTTDEIEQIVVATGAAVGAAVGQMFGIPAPIGAFVGSIVTSAVWGGLSDAFGWGPSAAELRGRAWDAMQAARAAMMSECLAVSIKAWNAYNEYWNGMIEGFAAALNANAVALGPGIRAFGKKHLTYVIDESGNEQPLPRTIKRACYDPMGCLYYGVYGDETYGFTRRPPATPHRLRETFQYGDIAPVGNWVGAKLPDGSIDPYIALGYYGAHRYATPYQAWLEIIGIPNHYMLADRCWIGGRLSGGYGACFGSAPRSDYEYLEHLSFIQSAPNPELLEQCVVPEWASYLMRSLVQVGPAAAFVMSDVSNTVAAEAAEQAVIARMQVDLDEYRARRQVVVQAAQERRDILRMRRQRASRQARIRYGLLAAGTGSLAGWLLAAGRRP